VSVARARGLGLDEIPAVGPAALCMGVFDGVHRGHQALLNATQNAAAAAGASSVALVFDPHPDEVVKPGTHVARLTPLTETLRLIAELGISHPLPIRFDADLRHLPAEEFLAALAPSVALRNLVMTPDSAFGRGRGGTVERMRELAPRRGFGVTVIEPVLEDGQPISSTRVREAVVRGDLAAVRRMGGPAYLEGEVVEGDHRGRELGFPTANLAFSYLAAMPPLGIYTGRVAVPERGVAAGHPSLVSIGVRPTFHDEGVQLVEVHLLDFDGDLYGATLHLHLLDRLRDELRFAGAGDLVAQMRRDEADARRLLGMPAQDGEGVESERKASDSGTIRRVTEMKVEE
jgi:riboflavin kinase/FMN adenylyltransferase